MELTAIKTMPIAELLELFMKKTSQTQGGISRAIEGMSTAQLSQIKSGTYKGDVEKAESTLRSYIEKELSDYSKKKGIRAKDIFIRFDGVKDLITDVDDAIEDNQMLLIRGKTGSGKTTLLKELLKQRKNAVMITGVKNVTEKNFLSKLLRALSGIPKGSTDDIYDAIIEKLKKKIVFIDEANHLNYATLERLRSLWDAAQVPFILSGTHDGISEILIEHQQIESRVLNVQTYYLDEDEIALLVEAFGFTCKDSYIKALDLAFNGMTRKTAWALEKWSKFVARGGLANIKSLDMAIEKMR